MKNYKFTINGNEYEVDLKSFEENIAEIEVNGTSYRVELKREIKTPKTPILVRNTVPPPSAPRPLVSSGKVSTIKSPLPGIILHLLVKPGDTVKKEQKLLVMEAMKMENNVLAEQDGLIKTIKVKEGDNVMQGDILIEME